MILDPVMIIHKTWGNLPNFHQRRGKEEWHSGCPKCNSSNPKTDRFMMKAFLNQEKPTVSGQCRQCGHTEYVFLLDGKAGQRELTSEELAELRASIERQAEAEKQARARAEETLQYHIQHISAWHDEMTPEQRELWHAHWMMDSTIDRYNLGFTPEKVVGYDDGKPVKKEALSIPIYGLDWEIGNIQWRILKAENGDKYRQVAGIPVGLFHCYPEMSIDGTVFVTEGVKKALCLNQVMLYATGEINNIIAVNNANPGDDLLIQFSQVKTMYLILDPDTRVPNVWGRSVQSGVVNRILTLNPNVEIRPINIPFKLDDFFYKFGASYDDFAMYIKTARPVIRSSEMQYMSIAELLNKE